MNTIDDLHELRDRLEIEFADLLLPDLKANGADRVHVVIASETDLSCSGEFSGLHSPRIHRWLRSYIPKWNGPAPTMLIDDATITNDCGGRWGEMQERFTAIAIHELGHVVCTPGLYARDDDLPDALGDVVRQLFVESIEKKATFYSGVSPRTGHGPEWLRGCCHLVHRMQRRGWEVRLPQVIDRDYYAYSSTACYARSLGDECERLADWPITSIATIPPPKKFLDQWESDLASWPDGEI